jgi:hypothetical protein
MFPVWLGFSWAVTGKLRVPIDTAISVIRIAAEVLFDVLRSMLFRLPMKLLKDAEVYRFASFKNMPEYAD